MTRLSLMALLCLSALIGCAQQVNPSFPISESDAQDALHQMKAQPRRLQRPLVILGGFADVGIGSALLKRQVEDLFDHPDVLIVRFADCTSFEQCRQRVLDRVDEGFGPGDKDKTVEVDVIGQSMGGLIAVVNTADFGDGQRRLNAKRIFTLSSPLRGARLAELTSWSLTDLQRDMRPNSEFYQVLAAARIDAELYCYTRLDDSIVGEDLASLDGRSAWWVDTPSLELAHIQGVLDDRILADVSRRLRGETAYATSPPAPLPSQTK